MVACFFVAACGSDDPGLTTTPDSGASDAATVLDGNGVPDVATPLDAAAVTCPGKRPSATNTGVPANVTLTVVTQDVVVTKDDTVIDAQDIKGFLTIKASRVRVTRSIVRGHATAATTAIIRIESGTDIVIEDTEIAADAPSVDVDGLSGSNVIARRLNVHGGVDGLKLGDNARLECSWVHGMVSFKSDPNQNDGPTHNDAIQILAGKNITIIGNSLEPSKDQNASIQITEDFGAVSGITIDSNWADGGGCSFNFSHKGAASLMVTTRNNRFGRNSFFDCPILKSTKTTLDTKGDVWDDDGTPVPVQTHD